MRAGCAANRLCCRAIYIYGTHFPSQGHTGVIPSSTLHDTPSFVLTIEMHGVLLKLLLDRGVDVAVTDRDATTALHRAVPNHGPYSPPPEGNLVAVKLLLAKGADATAQDSEGETALHRAAYSGNHLILCLLLDTGADLEARKNDGRTALLT